MRNEKENKTKIGIIDDDVGVWTRDSRWWRWIATLAVFCVVDVVVVVFVVACFKNNDACVFACACVRVCGRIWELLLLFYQRKSLAQLATQYRQEEQEQHRDNEDDDDDDHWRKLTRFVFCMLLCVYVCVFVCACVSLHYIYYIRISMRQKQRDFYLRTHIHTSSHTRFSSFSASIAEVLFRMKCVTWMQEAHIHIHTHTHTHICAHIETFAKLLEFYYYRLLVLARSLACLLVVLNIF